MPTRCEEPLVSVIMGVYYRREDTELLERAIQSILQQTYTNIEILIEDEGSSAKSMHYLEDLQRKDDRVRLLRGNDAFSLPQKLNICLRKAKGSFVARMDDDDYSHPTRLKKQLDYLREHGEVAFVGCQINRVRQGKCLGKRELPLMPTVRDFYMTQPFIHPTLLFRKEMLENVNGYSEALQANKCEDYDLLLRLYAKGHRGANLAETLLDYTVRPDAHDGRNMIDRWHETQTRFCRFRDLRQFPKALPYVVKPLAVGLIPKNILQELKKKRDESHV